MSHERLCELKRYGDALANWNPNFPGAVKIREAGRVILELTLVIDGAMEAGRLSLRDRVIRDVAEMSAVGRFG